NSHSMFADPVDLAVLFVVVAGTGLAVWGLGRVYGSYQLLRVPLLASSVVIGSLLAYGVLSPSTGYLAGLVWEQAALLTLLLWSVSAGLTALPRSTSNGRVCVFVALLMFAGVFAVYLSGYYLGLHAWRNDRPLPLR